MKGHLVVVIFHLKDSVIEYLTSALADADDLANSIQRETLHEPIVFAPRNVSESKLYALDAGGVATQYSSDKELSSYIAILKKKNFNLCSVIFNDPWSKIGDLEYAGIPPHEMVSLLGKINYLFDISCINHITIEEFRARAISYLKIIYLSEYSVGKIRAIIGSNSPDIAKTIALSVKQIFVNAYDDESWLGAKCISLGAGSKQVPGR